MPFEFSRRSAFSLQENALTRAVRAKSAYVDLTLANPTRAALSYAPDLLAPLAHPAGLHYEPEAFGNPALREVLGKSQNLPKERVFLTASTSEAYAFLFKVLTDPGDVVHIPAPSYPLFEHLARLEGVELAPYRVAYDGAWHIDASSIVVGPRSRAILVVSPNNPTGHYLKRAELTQLARFGLPIVSDEVFFPYAVREDPSRVSALEARAEALVFVLRGLSKEAGLPQLKLAWTFVDGPAPLVDAALARLELVADAFLSVGTPIQLAGEALLARQGALQAEIRSRVVANHRQLSLLLGTESPATLLDVEGGWYATLRLPRTRSEESWVLGLLDEADVLVHPGHFFDFEDEPYVVLSLLVPEPIFRRGAEALVRYVARG